MGLLTRYLAADRATGTSQIEAVTPGVELATASEVSTLEGVSWPEQTVGAVQIDRGEAMQVPALARARNVIAGTVGLLPLVLWTPDGSRVRNPRPWIGQPERDVPAAHTMAWTADDLMFHGIAYWRVSAEYAADSRPLAFERIAPSRVTPDRDRRTARVVGWRVDDRPAPRTGVGRLIVFPGLEEGLLVRAGRTIRTAVALEKAASNYADEPVPTSILRNTSGAHLPDKKVSELLGAWRTARKSKATAYLDALELQIVGLDPAGMQLVEARQHIAIEIARVCNLDPDYVGANASGSSLTYTNVTQERRKLVDFTLRHYLTTIEQRLSMDDVTTTGQLVRFDLDDFLRADPQVRAQVLATLLEQGVLTVDEAREREQLAPRDDEPQEPANA